MIKSFNNIVKDAALRVLGVTVTPDGEVLTTTSAQENCALASMSESGITAPKWAVLFDKSDIVNWPHRTDDFARIAYATLQVDKVPSTKGRLILGVVTRIDNTSADITLIRGLVFGNSEADFITRSENFSQSVIRTDVQNNTTRYIITSTRLLNVTSVNSLTTLDSARGPLTVVPAVGDLVVFYDHTSGGAWTGAVSILYTTEKV